MTFLECDKPYYEVSRFGFVDHGFHQFGRLLNLNLNLVILSADAGKVRLNEHEELRVNDRIANVHLTVCLDVTKDELNILTGFIALPDGPVAHLTFLFGYRVLFHSLVRLPIVLYEMKDHVANRQEYPNPHTHNVHLFHWVDERLWYLPHLLLV